MSDALALCGLVVSLFGAVLAASNLKPRPWLAYPDVAHAQYELLDQQRQARIRGYVSPPYDPAIVQEKVAEADRQHKEELRELRQRLWETELSDEWERKKRTLWGIVLTAVGTVLQGVAILML